MARPIVRPEDVARYLAQEHTPRIELEPVTLYRAACRCGWRASAAWQERSDAERDLRIHLAGRTKEAP